jgi:DNA-binding SARP family transcriptional activator
MLNIQLFGGLSLYVDDRRVPLDLGASGRLLVGYLFEFPGRAHRRERLADHFWPGLDAERARGALNTAIWRLRKILALEPRSEGGRNLVCNRGEIALELAPWLAVDTHAFDRSVGGARLGAVLDADEALGLERAIAHYFGPFMDGDDGDWVIEERERLHSLYVRALGDLVRSYALAGQYDKAIAAARRILSVDKFRESVQRQLMLLLFVNDRRVEALRHFSRWEGILRRELNIKPMPQTEALASAIASCEPESGKAWMAREFLGDGSRGARAIEP